MPLWPWWTRLCTNPVPKPTDRRRTCATWAMTPLADWWGGEHRVTSQSLARAALARRPPHAHRVGARFRTGICHTTPLKKQFEGKALRRDSMNGLGKLLGDLADGFFHAFAKVVNQKAFSRFAGPFAVCPAFGPQIILSYLAPGVFPRVFGLNGVSAEHAAGGQLLRLWGLEASNVRLAAYVDENSTATPSWVMSNSTLKA